MNYIYDILVNFNEQLYSFYDWNINDNIVHIRKMPFFKVDDKTLQVFKEYVINFSTEFLEKIKSKTEFFANKNVKTIPYAFLVSNGVEVIALNVGNNIKKSKLLIDEEAEVLEICERIEITKISYKVIKKKDNNYFKTRKEIEIEKYINKEIKKLYNENNHEKMAYLYYECFNEKENDNDKIVDRINYEIKYNSENIFPQLYKFFKLIQFNK